MRRNILISILAALTIIIMVSVHSIQVFAISNSSSQFDATSPVSLKFTPWGNPNNLVMNQVANGTNPPVLKLEGVTSKTAVGFASQELFYRGKDLSLIIGKLDKSPNSSQTSFSIDVRGLFKNYTILLTTGSSYPDGWRGDTYYKNIKSNSVNALNLSDIVASHNGLYLISKKVNIVIPKETTIHTMEFKFILQ